MQTSKEFILKLVLDTIDQKLGVKAEPEQRLKKDVGMDSLDLVEFGMELEAALQINLPDKDLEAIHHMTVEEVVSFLDNFIKHGASKS